MQLYNKLSSDERSKILDISKRKRITLSFYQYAHIKDPQIFRDKLFLEWQTLDVLGRTYVSYEGINAQISVPSENFLELLFIFKIGLFEKNTAHGACLM